MHLKIWMQIYTKSYLTVLTMVILTSFNVQSAKFYLFQLNNLKDSCMEIFCKTDKCM